MELAQWVQGKQRMTHLCVSIAIALLLFGFCFASAGERKALPSSVLAVKGRAEYRVDGGKWRNLKAGVRIDPGTSIRASEGSCVDILIGEKEPIKPAFGQNAVLYVFVPYQTRNILRVCSASTVRLDKVEGYRVSSWSNSVENISVTLESGELSADFPPLDAGGLHEVRIPDGKVLVKQAVFQLKLNGTLEVLSGAATLKQKQTNRDVLASQRFDPVTGTLTTLAGAGTQSHQPTMYRFPSDQSGPVQTRKF